MNESDQEYKDTAKAGDRLTYKSQYATKIQVIKVVARGVVCGLFCPGERWHHTHEILIEWNGLTDKLAIVHKEP